MRKILKTGAAKHFSHFQKVGRIGIWLQHTGSFWGTGDVPCLSIDGGLKTIYCVVDTYSFSHTACMFYNVLNGKNKL